MDIAVTVVVSVLSSTVVSSAFAVYLQSKRDRSQARWEAKRQACKEALDLVDALMANREWNEQGRPLAIQKQKAPHIAELRRCHNDLIVWCKNPAVAESFKNCLGFGTSTSGDSIVDLRNAVRRELDFGKPYEDDREASFLGAVAGATEGP